MIYGWALGTGYTSIAVTAFFLGFLAGWFAMMGVAMLIVLGFFWAVSDRRPISHDKRDSEGKIK